MPTGKIATVKHTGDGLGWGYIQPDGGGAQKRFKEAAFHGNFAGLQKGDSVTYENYLGNQAKLLTKTKAKVKKAKVKKAKAKK
jgi:hypothetical protein